MRPTFSAALLMGVAATLAACGSGGGTAGTTPASPSVGGAASPDVRPSSAAIAAGPWCDPAADPATGPDLGISYPGWPVPGQVQTSAAIPLIASSEQVAGRNRLVFTFVDTQNQLLSGPDVPVEARFYDLAADPATPVQVVEGVPIDAGAGRTLYRAGVDFRCAGRWGAEFVVGLPGGETSPRMTFSVQPASATPALGAPAPRSDSPTADSPEELAAISSDTEPDPGLYELTIAEAVTSGRPSVIAFATPSFCQTAMCGPVLDHLKAVAAEYRDRVAFVNVEPYELTLTANGLQPVLSAENALTPVPAVGEWGLRTEPYVFVVDAEGNVAAKLEGPIDEAELRAELDALVGQAAPARSTAPA